MNLDTILATIDKQIVKLQQARAMLVHGPAPVAKKSPGRPKKVAAQKKRTTVAKKTAR